MPSGRIGEAFTGYQIPRGEKEELEMYIKSIAGDDVNVAFRDEMRFPMDAEQAAAYGVPEGTMVRAAGVFTDQLDPGDDLITLGMGSGGRLIEFHKRIQIAFHEAFSPHPAAVFDRRRTQDLEVSSA